MENQETSTSDSTNNNEHMKDYKVNTSKDKKENSALISLQGHLGLGQINEIQADVLKAIKGSSSATIQIKDVEESDLSLYQLVQAIKKYCINHKITLKVEVDIPAEQQTLFAKSGINFTI